MDEIKVPKAAQFGFSLNGNIEGAAQLDCTGHAGGRGRLIGGINGVADVICPFDLGTKEIEQFLCLTVDAP